MTDQQPYASVSDLMQSENASKYAVPQYARYEGYFKRFLSFFLSFFFFSLPNFYVFLRPQSLLGNYVARAHILCFNIITNYSLNSLFGIFYYFALINNAKLGTPIYDPITQGLWNKFTLKRLLP